MGREQDAGVGGAQPRRIGQRVDALAEGAVADLVVRLQKRDKGAQGQMRAGLAAALARAKNRGLPLKDEALCQGATELGDRCVGVIGEVAVGLKCGEHMDGVVQVVVPLRCGRQRQAAFIALQVGGAVGVILQHDMHLALTARAGMQRRADLAHDVGLGVVAQRMDRVHAQSVKIEFLDPVQGVVNEEVAHRSGIGAVVVDGRAPGRLVRRVEKMRAAGVQVVALRPEVVVHHVNEHHQPEPVGGVDQGLEFVGRAVAGVGREGEHPVIAPVAPARKVGHGHEFDRRDAEFGQGRQAGLGRGKRAFGREGADMQFIDDGLFPAAPAPGAVLPGIGLRVNHLTGAMHVVGIEARGRIGHARAAGQGVAVTVAGPGAGQRQPVPAVFVARHRVRARAGAGPVLQRDLVEAGRPQCEAHASAVQHRGAKRHGMRELHGSLLRAVLARVSRTSERDCRG